jgi:hypothetical protein
MLLTRKSVTRRALHRLWRSLAGHRADASHFSNACRAEAWRLRRLLAGRPVGRYKCLADRLAAYGRVRLPSRSQEPRQAA